MEDNKKIKTLTVGCVPQIKQISYYKSEYKLVPQLRMSGAWMKNLGFNIGDKVKVTKEQNKIIIERIVN